MKKSVQRRIIDPFLRSVCQLVISGQVVWLENDSISAFFINLGEEEIKKNSGSSGGEGLCLMTLRSYNHLWDSPLSNPVYSSVLPQRGVGGSPQGDYSAPPGNSRARNRQRARSPGRRMFKAMRGKDRNMIEALHGKTSLSVLKFNFDSGLSEVISNCPGAIFVTISELEHEIK